MNYLTKYTVKDRRNVQQGSNFCNFAITRIYREMVYFEFPVA